MKISWLCLFTVIDVALTYERKQFEHHILIKTHIRKTRWVLLAGLASLSATKGNKSCCNVLRDVSFALPITTAAMLVLST